jgi:hypothetical protein
MLTLSKLQQSMSVTKYFEIVNPTYIIYKITPHSSCRNYNTDTIANVMSTIKNRIWKEERKYFVESKMKCTYMIDIYKNDVSFYFIVPSQYKMLLKEKLQTTWDKATIQEVDSIKGFNPKSIAYEIKYKYHNALSVTVDKKSNTLLNNILNVIDVLEQDDRVSILYNFTSCNNWGWKANCERVQNKFTQNINTPHVATKVSIVFNIFCYVLDFIERLTDELLNNKTKEYNPITELNNVLKEKTRKLSASSLTKLNDTVINTQIGVISYSENKTRANNNAIMTCQGFYTLKGDNEFEYERVCKSINVLDTNLHLTNNKIGVEESSALLQLAGKDLLDKHKITHVNITESIIPKELMQGVMCIGENTYKGTKEKAYLSKDKDLQMLTLCLIGATRSGKSTLIANLCNDSLKVGETNIILDWCGNCELSNELIQKFPNALVINCDDFSKLQGLGYNELYTDSNNPFQIYRSAKQQASQLTTLINASMGGDEDLRARMERYLGASAIITFMSKGSVKDVFLVLQDYNLRHKYINRLGSRFEEYISEYVNYLLELDDKNEGTKLTAVQGILNRLSKLKENPYMEMMLKKDCTHNFNLVDEMQKAQLICIKMPEIMFNTEQEKDTYATYWLTKIWGALQQRKWYINPSDIVKTNIYFDELYQVKSCQEFLRSKLSQIAKFGGKPIISCHYLGQIQCIRNELKSANASYIIISGADKDNFKELQNELSPYTLEDLLNLKRYHALNLIKYEGGYSKFITKLPKPI